MDARGLKAVSLGVRLAHLLRGLVPGESGSEPFMPVAFQTPAGELRWELPLSEAAVERLTGLLEAEEDRQRAARRGRPCLRSVPENGASQ